MVDNINSCRCQSSPEQSKLSGYVNKLSKHCFSSCATNISPNGCQQQNGKKILQEVYSQKVHLIKQQFFAGFDKIS